MKSTVDLGLSCEVFDTESNLFFVFDDFLFDITLYTGLFLLAAIGFGRLTPVFILRFTGASISSIVD